MSGPGGVFPSGAFLNPVRGLPQSLQPGLTYLATVIADGDGLALEIGTARVPVQSGGNLGQSTATGQASQSAAQANTNAPLPGGQAGQQPQAALIPGAQVRVRVTQSANGLLLKLIPAATALTQTAARSALPAATASAPSNDSAFIAALARALETLSIAKAPRDAAPIISRQTPANAEIIGRVLALFNADDNLTEDVARVAQTIRGAVTVNAIATDATQGLLAALAAASDDDPQGLIAIIRRWQAHATRTTEARIARAFQNAQGDNAVPQQAPRSDSGAAPARGERPAPANPQQNASHPQRQAQDTGSRPQTASQSEGQTRNLASGSATARGAASQSAFRPEEALATALARDLRTQLAQLLENEGFQRHLKNEGQTDNFRQAADRLVQRLVATQTHNTHALDLPYQFLEIPFSPDAGISRAQIHLFGDREGGKQRFGAGHTAIAFDMDTSHLGPLWIHLAMLQNNCTCTVHAVEDRAAKLIAEHSDELAEGLKRAGFEMAAVHSALWDGDRFEAAVQLFQPFTRFDTKA